jgi:transposase InsO family protein
MLEEQDPGALPQGANVQLVHHSDAGSQHTSNDYTQTLTDDGVLASIGSVGDAHDCLLVSRARGWTERFGERAPSLNDGARIVSRYQGALACTTPPQKRLDHAAVEPDAT